MSKKSKKFLSNFLNPTSILRLNYFVCDFFAAALPLSIEIAFYIKKKKSKINIVIDNDHQEEK
jgi:hypothetical protein